MLKKAEIVLTAVHAILLTFHARAHVRLIHLLNQSIAACTHRNELPDGRQQHVFRPREQHVYPLSIHPDRQWQETGPHQLNRTTKTAIFS